MNYRSTISDLESEGYNSPIDSPSKSYKVYMTTESDESNPRDKHVPT